MLTKKIMKAVYFVSITVFLLLLVSFTGYPNIVDKDENIEDVTIFNPEYQILIDSARFYIKKDDSLSLVYYLRAFAEELPENPTHIYESASMSAKLGEKDLAFFLLNLSVDKRFSYYDHFLKNECFPKLDREKFNKSLSKVRETDSIYKQISVQLDAIYDSDQDIREYYHSELGKGKDKDSPEMKAILDSMSIVDSKNFAVVNELIKKHGFLGNNLKTFKSRAAMFAVIQHASTEEKERLLPVFHHALRNGELQPQLFAYIEDRMLVNKENVQKYGTQYRIQDGEVVIYPPLIDSTMVDIYRKSVGLEPLEKYIDQINKMENP